MSKSKMGTGDWAANTTKNTFRLMCWTVLWVLTMALANFGPKFIWHSNKLLTSLAILLNIAIGFGMLFANNELLKGMDELQKKIQLEAMALSLGVGLVVGLGVANGNTMKLLPFRVEVSHLAILLSFTYMAGIGVGHWRYR